jgi:AcrR family transcriptional regulator
MSAVDLNLARRKEIGLERRERTRMRLLTAAARVLAEHGENKATIEDFAQAAGVTRGTFYNHYRTVTELVDDLWTYIGHDPFLAIQSACASIASPAERLIAVTRLVLEVGERDEVWGWVIYSMSGSNETVNEELLSFPQPVLEEGLGDGEFRYDDLIAANDMVVSTIRGALHRVLCEHRSNGYPAAVGKLILRALGVSKSQAASILRQPLPVLERPASRTLKGD